jgi:hypothetical protein
MAEIPETADTQPEGKTSTFADIESLGAVEEAPELSDIHVQVNDLVTLAIDLWRLEQRLNRILPGLPEEQRENVSNSMQKLKRYLDKNSIEVLDHTNQKYGDSQNLEILAVEQDSSITDPIIKETKEPTILYKGQVVHIGKVILLSKDAHEEIQHD